MAAKSKKDKDIHSPMVFGRHLCTHAEGLIDESAYSGSAKTKSRYE